MTIIKIDKAHKDIVLKALAENMIPVNCYTIETNSEMLAVAIECDDPAILFYLGRIIGMTITHESWMQDLAR